MATEFGAGIFLDEQFDFSVDPTGDLQSAEGEDELHKDIAFQMSRQLQEFLGRPPGGTLEAEVKNVATAVAEADTRIERVDKESLIVTFGDNRNELEIVMTAATTDGEQELVFNI